CKVIAILGIGGVGKTSLAITLAHQIQESFTHIIWRSLQNIPPLTSILQDCIQFLSDQQQIDFPKDIESQITLLISYLQKHRSLLILDNIESILLDGKPTGFYRAGYEVYGKFIQCLGEVHHQSCLLLTSREKPYEVALLEGKTSPVRSYLLEGLKPKDGFEILKSKGLRESVPTWKVLIDRYAGNPLALKLVAQLICEVFNYNVATFLQDG